ncbi:MAG: acyl-CoA thioesterase [Legionella sp.]|nr:acyl-CoA thioesterase [Legionella sp.]
MQTKANNNLIHRKIFSIAWGDMDALGHVNNVRYFDYFQQARVEWLESLHLDMQQGIGPVVAHVECFFLKPIVYPATLEIHSYIGKIGRSSATLIHEIYQEGVLMAQGSTKAVWIDYNKKISVPLPEAIREAFDNQQCSN